MTEEHQTYYHFDISVTVHHIYKEDVPT